MRFIGLDAGSVSVKLVVFDEAGGKCYARYERHKGHPLAVALRLLNEEIRKHEPSCLEPGGSSLSITGSAGRLLASVLKIEPLNEIVCQAYSTRFLYPHILTIIEMGGEDSKLILLDPKGHSISDFSMNSVCAAGTGSFLDQQAERLRLSIEEFSTLALKSQKPPRIAGRCSVFAKSDMIHLQQIATPVEEIVAGLCFAVARNFKGSIARGRDIRPPISFQGGVAANAGMVRAFREVFQVDEIFVPEDFALMGAAGAALKSSHEGIIQHFDISLLEEFLKSYRPLEEFYLPLSEEQSLKADGRPKGVSSAEKHGSDRVNESLEGPVEAYLGIDIGSISTNLAVITREGKLLAKRYLMTAGRPIDAVRTGLAEIAGEVGDKVRIAGVGTTGSGRYMIADYVGADVVKNEITAQATAAAFIDQRVDTIFEIGGQDSKYISLEDGLISDFEMNKACAAGTGSFLEEQAEKLNVSIKEEFETRALAAKHPCRLGERCTVFMENSLMSNLQKGASPDDLLAGLAYSIVQNYVNRVVAGKKIGRNIFFQGGVAFNKSVVAAFERHLGTKITVPPHHDVTGAIGMGLIARDHMAVASEKAKPGLTSSSFKGFELSGIPYEISTFECKGCPNVCEINRVKISGEKSYLFYGGRCEKYDIRKKSAERPEDLFAFREEMLWKDHNARVRDSQNGTGSGKKPVIGIPYIFFFHDFLPLWSTFLHELGFEVKVSPPTNRQVVNMGLEKVLSEACFPVKVAHGHIHFLMSEGVDAVFLPNFQNLAERDSAVERAYGCPYTQTIPDVGKIAFHNSRFIAPVINLKRGESFLIRELFEALAPFGAGKSSVKKALSEGRKAQERFRDAIRKKSQEVLSSLTNDAIVIVGRSYNALDKGINLELPKKLADLGVLSLPFDFLPLEEIRTTHQWPNMYWRSGQTILKTAAFIRADRRLNAIYLGSFLCGPDSFILKFFKEEMGEKPFLHIEIDEHSADAGAITRCEAFLDSLKNHRSFAGRPGKSGEPSRDGKKSMWYSSGIERITSRTIYIPRMSDHAFALAAAFNRCGIRAEVLPESDKRTTDIGRKFSSGKECYPCIVTTGDMVKKTSEAAFDPERSAFFMPSGTGPCRFGQYNIFHRMVLNSIGLGSVPIFSPTQDTTFYRDLGIVGKEFTMQAWKGIIAYELLEKCLHETRPYEKEKGEADALYGSYHRKLYETLETNGRVEETLSAIRDSFGSIRRNGIRRPLIGVVGEIFVRSHKFSNEDLIRKIEGLGGEVWLAPVEEWIYYVNLMGLKKALLKREKSAIISFFLKKFVQKRIEHRFGKRFEGFLKTLHEPGTKELLEKASPYLNGSFEGEAILSVGKSIDLWSRGAAGIINAMPFGCMPGTIVTALLRGVSRDLGIPCLSIPYDGSESSTAGIQLEAFMDQAREYGKSRAGVAH